MWKIGFQNFRVSTYFFFTFFQRFTSLITKHFPFWGIANQKWSKVHHGMYWVRACREEYTSKSILNFSLFLLFLHAHDNYCPAILDKQSLHIQGINNYKLILSRYCVNVMDSSIGLIVKKWNWLTKYENVWLSIVRYTSVKMLTSQLVTTGLTLGILHVLAGPDHLSALVGEYRYICMCTYIYICIYIYIYIYAWV
jgi:hypothetical protein